MDIKPWIKTELITASPDISVQEAVNIFLEKKVGTLPVIDSENNFLGAILIKDVMKMFVPSFFDMISDFEGFIDCTEDYGALEIPAIESKAMLSKKITDVMDKHIPVVSENISVFSAVTFITHHKLQDLLIVTDGKLKGLVSMVDLGAAFLTWLQEEESS